MTPNKIILVCLIVCHKTGSNSVHSVTCNVFTDGAITDKICCNIIGDNCKGPCWNRGCQLCGCDMEPDNFVCADNHPCPGTDLHLKHDAPGDARFGTTGYACCSSDQNCRPNVPASEACCNKKMLLKKIEDITFSKTDAQTSPDTVTDQVSYIFKGENLDKGVLVTPEKGDDVKVHLTISWHFDDEEAVGVGVEIEEVPLISKLSGSYTTTGTTGQETTRTIEKGASITVPSQSIPPYSRKVFKFDAKMEIVTKTFTHIRGRSKNDCDEWQTEQLPYTGKMVVKGSATFTKGTSFSKAGPAVPIECPISPFDVPLEDQTNTMEFCPRSGGKMCKDNPVCVRYLIHFPTNGECCTPDNLYPCCAIAAAHPQCLWMGFPKMSILCPNQHGRFHPCCEWRPDAPPTKMTATNTATCEGNAKGAPCSFPFYYKFKKYTSCTTKGSETGRPWCYTGNGLWGYCDCEKKQVTTTIGQQQTWKQTFIDCPKWGSFITEECKSERPPFPPPEGECYIYKSGFFFLNQTDKSTYCTEFKTNPQCSKNENAKSRLEDICKSFSVTTTTTTIRPKQKEPLKGQKRDPANDFVYSCDKTSDPPHSATTYATYNAKTLTPAQKRKAEQKWPGKPASHYACVQGCATGCDKLMKDGFKIFSVMKDVKETTHEGREEEMDDVMIGNSVRQQVSMTTLVLIAIIAR